MHLQDLEGYSRIRDLPKIKGQIWKNVDGVWDLTVTREAEFAKICAGHG